MDHKTPKKRTPDPLVMRLWPDVGQALRISRNQTYELAQAGKIPVIPNVRPFRVPTAWLRKITSGEA
jgi:hypothetical protein